MLLQIINLFYNCSYCHRNIADYCHAYNNDSLESQDNNKKKKKLDISLSVIYIKVFFDNVSTD